MNMETNHHTEWLNDGTQQRGAAGHRQHGVLVTREPGQKGRANTTLRGTLSARSHTSVFLRKDEAEIRDWRQWFC